MQFLPSRIFDFIGVLFTKPAESEWGGDAPHRQVGVQGTLKVDGGGVVSREIERKTPIHLFKWIDTLCTFK